MTITVGIGALTITDVVNVARHDAPIVLDPAALAEVAKTRQHIEELATEPTPVYGVSTGFGALARRHIPQELRTQLQRSLVRSHAAGSGPEVERDVIRALMLLRLSTLMTGRTGVRPVVVETYAALLNAGITPIVYEYGSLGCSGDLAPLAHCALALMGEGDVRLADGTKTPGRPAALPTFAPSSPTPASSPPPTPNSNATTSKTPTPSVAPHRSPALSVTPPTTPPPSPTGNSPPPSTTR